MKVKSESEVAQSCATLSDPMDCSLPGSSVHGSFRARVLKWVVSAFSGFNYYIFIISFEIKELNVSSFVLFSQDCFCSLGVFYNSIQILGFFSISVKNAIGIYINIALNL